MQTTATTDHHFDGSDYNLRVLIERMERMHRSEHEIEAAEGFFVVLPATGKVGRHLAVSGTINREGESTRGAGSESVKTIEHIARFVVVGKPADIDRSIFLQN